jgi:outer membrane receptor protein involved in Fe transport
MRSALLLLAVSQLWAQTTASAPDILKTSVTITAQRSGKLETESSPVVAYSVENERYKQQPLPTLGNVLEALPGIHVQQSTYGQVSPFLRGLTGYQVLNLIDEVRFNNSTFRSGPNQYLAFVDPSQAFRVEAVLGPAGAQYGSDAMGGAIHVVTPEAHCSPGAGLTRRGELGFTSATADRSAAASAQLLLSSRRLAWLIGGSGRGLGDLRAGRATDSRHVLRRLFGLDQSQIRQVTGTRLRESGFAHYGLHSKLAVRPTAAHLLTVWYQRSELDSIRGYKDLWGGLGRAESLFTPQALDFLYARVERLNWSRLDRVSFTFSLNEQRDGSRRQGLRLTDPLINDANSVRAYGYSAQAATHWGSRQAVVFGGDWYDERIDSRRSVLSAGSSAIERALYPNGSVYRLGGLFLEQTVELPKGLRALGAVRLTRTAFRSHADRNRDSSGRPLGVADSAQAFHDVTFQASLSWQAVGPLTLHALAGRGFRAPNLNDLGAVGLNDLGFEIPAADSVGAAALLGSSAGENAVWGGRRVETLRPEHLYNFEAGVTLRSKRHYFRLQGFHADLHDPIVRRTLLFSTSSIPAALGGIPVSPIAPTPAQRAQNVVAVATSLDPRAVKAFVNDGQTRYYGLEAIARWTPALHWRAEAGYSILAGRDLHPNRHVRRLPPQTGAASLRYHRRLWIEVRLTAAGAQQRLSGGDLDDERIGASRRRRDIADFFSSARIAPWVSGGRFTVTGETLAGIQDRVLPLGSIVHGVRIVDDLTRAPLYAATSGWLRADLLAGIPVGERWRIGGGIANLADRNFRVHGSGVDAPGINAFVHLQFRF